MRAKLFKTNSFRSFYQVNCDAVSNTSLLDDSFEFRLSVDGIISSLVTLTTYLRHRLIRFIGEFLTSVMWNPMFASSSYMHLHLQLKCDSLQFPLNSWLTLNAKLLSDFQHFSFASYFITLGKVWLHLTVLFMQKILFSKMKDAQGVWCSVPLDHIQDLLVITFIHLIGKLAHHPINFILLILALESVEEPQIWGKNYL